ncbi:MAG: formylglycine-generating enzyme family protein [Gammaproteobacteria bacterium]|nr:formylglycine-generating enzyme family protein [Gammaproteobacteria bacterium]
MLRLVIIHLILILYGFSATVSARIVPGFDLIAMKNGDIHHGTVAHEAFEFRTDYATLSIPYHLMAEIQMGDNNQPDLLITRPGDHFTGKLIAVEITLLRSQQPVLQLHLEDIMAITFTPRTVRESQYISPDSIELANGDYFSAEIQLGDLEIKTSEKVYAISHEDIYLLDFALLNDGQEILVQVTLNDRSFHQGYLPALTSMNLATRYGKINNLPIENIQSLAYHVNHQSNALSINYRRHVNPGSLLHDEILAGRKGPALIILRGGDFQRGDYQGDGDADERPLLPVKLPAFAISMYEVSFAEYDYFCEDTRREKPDDSGWGRGQRPVVNVSWNDAVAYTEWLSRKTRHIYRLPSDAEWEYAARADTQTRYWWGNDLKPAYANCAGCGSIWDAEITAPVGKFPPNNFGLHDTAGNVFEWVADCFHTDFIEAPVDGKPLDKPGCGKRVIRGGAWSFPPKEVRSANRWRDFPTRQSDDTGFRVVRELN